MASRDSSRELLSANLALRLSAASRRATDARRLIKITRDSISGLVGPFSAPADRITYFDRLLEELAGGQPIPGLSTPQLRRCEIAARIMLPDAAVMSLLQDLRDMGRIHLQNEDELRLTVRVTPNGWQHVDQLRRGIGRLNRAFVAMWFDAKTAPAYENGIKPALIECGYEPPFRVDDVEHDVEETAGKYIPRIDDRIFAEIRRSRFVVADFTGHRSGVYYEAGFAEGLAIPILWCCHAKKSEIKKMSFDTRQIQHIIWTDPADLRTQLTAKISRRGWRLTEPHATGT